MIRKFNYTGRKKINRSDISIKLIGEKKDKKFFASLDLNGYNLPSSANIYIEPYFRYSTIRFNFGTVGEIIPPQDTLLWEISSNIIYFRVKVVDETSQVGRLLAYADHLKAYSEEEEGINPTKSILPVDYNSDLGQQVWKVSFDTSRPVLHINSRFKNGRELVLSEQFLALVFPSVIRQIFTKITEEISSHDETEEDHWSFIWLKYSKSVFNLYEMPYDDSSDSQIETNEWIENAVDKFCRKNSVLSKLESINV